MATKLTPQSRLFIIVASLVLAISRATSSNQSLEFTVPLIHIDSPESPFYNPSLTHEERMINACQRSYDRAKYLSKMISPPLIQNLGIFFMKLSIGTPRVDVWALVTLSDLSWIQCHPCVNCFRQMGPIFIPRYSSTYKLIPYNSRLCQTFLKSSNAGRNICAYEIRYGDSSYTRGTLSMDKFYFKSSTSNNELIAFNDIIFGCGHNNSGSLEARGGRGTGVIGLGGRTFSLNTQLGESIGSQFSYCLVNNFSSNDIQSSSIRFGRAGEVSGPGVIVTPMYRDLWSMIFYLNLYGMSVDHNKRIEFHEKVRYRKGEYINIDVGTTFTTLPPKIYKWLKEDVMAAIGNIKPIQPPSGSHLNLCYRRKDLHVSNLPTITAHFEGGDIKLNHYNTFIWFEEMVCLAIIPSPGDNIPPIYGIYAQQNFLVGFDFKKGFVSFKPTDCAKA